MVCCEPKKKVYELQFLIKVCSFVQIPSVLGSFRTEKEKTNAFNYHENDAVSRTGVHGHGIYQAAKS